MDAPQAHDSASAARIVALEERLTFQQRLIDELNLALLGQRRELDQLARELESYRYLLERLHQQGGGENLPHEKPPHY